MTTALYNARLACFRGGEYVLNIKQLTYVAAVVESGSLSAAAKKLYVTVQTISKAISDLENELGHTLFVRMNRGMKTTPFGQEFYQQASEVVSRFDNLIEFARGYDGSLQSPCDLRLALNTPPFAGNEAVRKNSAALIKNHLDIDVIIDLVVGEAGLESLFAGTYDALVTIGEVHCPGTECHVIGTVPLAIMMSEQHPLACCETLTLSDLLPYPIAHSGLWFASCNETSSEIFRQRIANLNFVEIDLDDFHEHFNKEGLSIAVGIAALEKASPSLVLRFFAPQDLITAPICLVGLEGRTFSVPSAIGNMIKMIL